MLKSVHFLTSVLIVSLLSGGNASAFEFNIIDVPGSSDRGARGVNNLGQIVGEYQPVGVDRFDIWVRDPDGTINTFTLPTGRSAQVHGINDLGQVAGLSTTIDDPNTAISFGWVYDINTGQYREYNYAPAGDETEPDAAITEVTNDGQTVVGWYDTTATDFEYAGLVDSIDRGNLSTIDGPNDRPLTFIWGTNDSGVLVGRDFRSAFVSTDGVNFDLFQIDGNLTTALDINNPGVVVGANFSSDFSEQFGFILTDTALVSGISAPGAVSTSIWGINDAGIFAGTYVDANGDSFAYYSVVPEPSLIVIFTSTLFGYGLVRRRRSF
ncbi:MAG: hypothetical protein AAGF97_02545 [Planctomycetota bacterium]